MLEDHLVAHRGWQSRFPENTLPALAGAIDAGARRVEFDIQLSADGEPLLCHDPTLQRLCASPLDITRAHRADWQALSAHEPGRFGTRFLGTPLATLADAVALLRRYPDVTAYAELKRHSLRAFGATRMLDAVLPQLDAIASHCVLISFDLAVLQQARERGLTRLALVLTDWPQAFSPAVAALAPELLFGSDSVLAPLSPDTPAPYPCAVYEIESRPQVDAWLARGARWVETFCIGELLHSDAELARHAG